jgi:hypothetical protein
MTKPQFRQINTADVSDEVIDLISDSMNVPTLVKPDAAVPTARQLDGQTGGCWDVRDNGRR